MYENRRQNYDPEIHEEYFIPCHIIHSHVQTSIAMKWTHLIRLKCNTLLLYCECNIWIFKGFVKLKILNWNFLGFQGFFL